MTTPDDLRCEYMPNPIGLDTTRPRFSWKLTDTEQTRGQRQLAYQLQVLDAVGPAHVCLWTWWGKRYHI